MERWAVFAGAWAKDCVDADEYYDVVVGNDNDLKKRLLLYCHRYCCKVHVLPMQIFAVDGVVVVVGEAHS